MAADPPCRQPPPFHVATVTAERSMTTGAAKAVPDTCGMLARVSRLLFIAWFALLTTVLTLAAREGWTIGNRIALYALLFAHPTFLALEMLLARRSARCAMPRAKWRDVAKALAGEWLASTIIFGWRMPWRSQAVEDHLPAGARGLRGVVFIHGYVCNRGLWNPWMRRLRKLERACVAVTLEPLFTSLDDYVAIVERAVRRVEAATGLAPVIVAHSMGGLVARAWLRSRTTLSQRDAADEVARLITIGTPHRGTWMAGLARTPNGRQMRIASAWLTALEADESPTLAALVTSWYGNCDQVIHPQQSAVYPGSEARLLRGVGHVALTAREEIWNEIRWRIDY
jgi:pimeloyl-ACP methyl ester carboxylesterase